MDENKFDEPIKFWSLKRGLPWLLIKSQILQESQFNPRAKSPCGARGLMQLMPPMMADIGQIEFSPEATFDDLVLIPEWNIEYGTLYDRIQYDHFPEIPDGIERLKFMLAKRRDRIYDQ